MRISASNCDTTHGGRRRAAICAGLLCCLLSGPSTAADGAAIEVVSPKGLRIWLVEEHGAPVVTLGFRFAGGSAQDPAGKEGTASFDAQMFLGGGGALAADAYLAEWSKTGSEINVEARLESIRGTVRVLTPDLGKAVDLLALAVNAPRFDRDAIEQVRDQLTADFDRNASNPESAAYLTYDREGYDGHPRGRPVGGTRAGLASITAAGLIDYRERVLTRDGLTLSAVGDISAKDIGAVVDRVFSELPLHGSRRAVPPPPASSAKRIDLDLKSGEAAVVFGVSLPGLGERERLAAELLNYSFGGSAFTSRLYHSVREQRGLAYAIGTTFDRFSFMSEVSGSFNSSPATVEQAIGLVRAEFERLSADPPSDAEVEEAKAALAGDYLRGLIRQADMANELTLRMAEGARPDCIETHAAQLAAIAPREVRGLARAIAWQSRLVIVTAGAPPASGGRSRLQPSAAKQP